MNHTFLDVKLSSIAILYYLSSFFTVDFSMKFIVFMITVGYTARRWYLLEKNKKDE
jgi:hypothetical protein